jgi:hypothetical protein
MLLVLSIVALVKVGNGSAPIGHLTPTWSWFNPFDVSAHRLHQRFTLDAVHLLGMGHDGVGQRGDGRIPDHVPGRAAVLSTLVLLVTYVLVILSAQSYAGVGTKGIGLGNPANEGDVLSVLGHAVFGTSGFGSVLTHLSC